MSATEPIRVWDITSEAFVAPDDFEEFDARGWSDNGLPSFSTAHDWSPDDKQLVRAGGRLDVFSADLSRQTFSSPQSVFLGSYAELSPNGYQLLTNAIWPEGFIWSSEGKRQRSYETPPHQTAHWAPDSETLYSGDWKGFWEIREAERIYHEVAEAGGNIDWLSPNADGTLLAASTSSTDGAGGVAILKPNGELVRWIRLSDSARGDSKVDWSPVSDLILAEYDQKFHIIDPQKNWRVQQLGRAVGANEAFWNPDGTIITDIGGQHWQLSGERIPGNPQVDKYGWGCLAWRPDGKQFVAFDGFRHSLRTHQQTSIGRALNNYSAAPGNYSWNPIFAMIAMHGEHSDIDCLDATSLKPYWHAILLPAGTSVTFTPAGQILDGEQAAIENYLRYYVETDDGRVETLTPSEFEARIGQSIYAPEAEPAIAVDHQTLKSE